MVKKKLNWKKIFFQQGIALVLLIITISTVPGFLCSRGADAFYNGDKERHERFIREIEKIINSELTSKDYTTGNATYSGEWLFGTYMIAGMGLGQTALEHPEFKTKNFDLMNKCIDKILSPQGKEFDRMMWGEDPIDSLNSDTDHAAYLGYFNLLLSYHRLIYGNSRYANLNDKITEKLVRNLNKSELLLLYTYPNELYPMDNSAVIGSIGLYDRATGSNHKDILNKWKKNLKEKYIDPKTGLMYQTPNPPGRGSGTAISIYFLSFADMELSEELYKALKLHLACSSSGFGAVREYPYGVTDGGADIDSGPIVFGLGLSATGFALSGSRIHKDPAFYSKLYSTSCLFGAPLDSKDRHSYVMGGPVGNAIMFTMLTAHSDLPGEKK